MPELPDIELYRVHIAERTLGSTLEAIHFYNPFVLRTFSPDKAEFAGATVTEIGRIGKRIVVSTDRDLHVVIHLMIAGRFDWKDRPLAGRPNGKVQIASVDFSAGTLVLQEVAKQKRASIHLVKGDPGALDPGGLEPYEITLSKFTDLLKEDRRTLKRILTDPKVLSGIGNAYSDEILHAARLSPTKPGANLSEDEVQTLYEAMLKTLRTWEARMQAEFPAFPKPAQITAFRPDFAAHGRFGEPCPICRHKIQRIVRGEHETNYCAACQTGGKLLADLSLSKLLKDAWPKTLEEMEGG